MKIITDDVEVFDWLAQAGVENFDPSKKTVFDFSWGESWCLFLFNPAGVKKGCRLYVLEKVGFEIEMREQLLPELLSLNDNHGYIILKNEALKIVESWISGRKGNQLFFDAH